MQDKPTAIELLEALEAFLREEVAPHVEGGLRFKVLVATNVAGIIARELALAGSQDRAQRERLTALLDRAGARDRGSRPDKPAASNEDTAAAVRRLFFELCERIDGGEADEGPWREQVLAHLRACVAEKLAVDNPKAR
ncbi:MAG TPA: DUF6285 domain-containing protein [Candidatus Binatia bacterium]|jgi:hypothetical protein